MWGHHEIRKTRRRDRIQGVHPYIEISGVVVFKMWEGYLSGEALLAHEMVFSAI